MYLASRKRRGYTYIHPRGVRGIRRSEDPQRDYIGLDPCAKHISKQAADLRSIDEEKIKTREAHRRRDSKVYIVYIYYIIIFFFLSYSITSLFL